jgi:hypothetical protein
VIEALEGLTREQILELADRETPKQERGTWTLTSPSGLIYTGTSPLACMRAETEVRVPPLVALARMQRGTWEDDAAIEKFVTTSPLL